MKTKRQRKIIELITNYDIETQEELAAKLVENGFKPLPTWQDAVARYLKEIEF